MNINGIEQAVSLYCFTQRLVERPEYNLESMFAELQELGVKKYELIGSQVFENYPRPAAAEIENVLKLAEKYELTPFSYGGYIDWGRVSGHTPTDADVILDLTQDLMTARDLNCTYLRSGEVPAHLVPQAASLAEKYGVKVGFEIHAPSRPSDDRVQGLRKAFDELGSEYIGFIPDFGCFIERPTEPALQRYESLGASRENLEYIIANRHSGKSADELLDEVGGGMGEKVAISEFFGFLSFGPADVEGFKTLLSHSLYFHSKFYHVTEELTDPTIPVEPLLHAIQDSGFQGVLLTEYEGHAFSLDDAHEQIRRHLLLERKFLTNRG